MEIIAIKDKDGGYTAHHSAFPAIIIKAETTDEIKEKFINVFYDIIMGTEIIVKEIKSRTI